MTWAEGKIKTCVETLREGRYLDDDNNPVEGAKLHAYDLAEHASWSRNPDLRDCCGYLEAWADVADMTVGEFIEFVEGGRRLNLMLEETTP